MKWEKMFKNNSPSRMKGLHKKDNGGITNGICNIK